MACFVIYQTSNVLLTQKKNTHTNKNVCVHVLKNGEKWHISHLYMTGALGVLCGHCHDNPRHISSG